LVDWQLADDERVFDLTSEAARLLGCPTRIAIGVAADKRQVIADVTRQIIAIPEGH
jgi:hypothetical protein